VVLRKKLTVLLATVMMLGVMSVSPALAHHDVGHDNNGNKVSDGADANEGGGQEKPKNAHPPHGGGEQHGGGSV
jgi:hypothetical protein